MYLFSDINYCAKSCALGIFLLLSSLCHADESAGVVTFSIGKAYINSEPVASGSSIKQGDVVETLSNGHVHIRFVDNGLVSIRPNSKLNVEHYEYNAHDPQASIIKFNLNEGIMRSISGSGAKAARDKFRLNTPIAAIGVRGTDFVVKADNNSLQALVNEGAIVVAPFSTSCSAGDFGPCSGSIELNSHSKQLLQLSSPYDTPRLVPLSEAFSSELLKQQVDQNKVNSEKNGKQNNEASSSEDSEGTSQEDADAIKQEIKSQGSDSQSSSDTSEKNEALNRSTLKNSLFDSLKHEGLSESEAATLMADNNTTKALPYNDKQQMAWGRYSGGPNLNQQPTLGFDTAVIQIGQAANNKELVTVVPGGANGLPKIMSLYRAKSSELETLNTSLGQLNYNLNPSLSQANLFDFGSDGQSPEALTLVNGDLAIDFTNGTFNTNLTMFLSKDINIQYSKSGTIDANGILQSMYPDKTFGGASTLDGELATYMFYKDIENLGTVEGVTSWFKQ